MTRYAVEYSPQHRPSESNTPEPRRLSFSIPRRMNASDQERPEGTGESEAAATEPQPLPANRVGDPPAPRVATATDDEVDGVRAGSPFRVDPPGALQAVPDPAPVEAVYADYGPFLYTSMGASVSAVMVLLFAAAGAIWFPAGGAIVAVLGTVLSTTGLFAARRFRLAALTCLPLHVGLFLFSYAKTLA